MKLELETLELESGKHDSPEKGVCIMEAVSIAAGEDFTDFPACTDRVIAKAAQVLNDRMPKNLRNELLKPLIFDLIGTNGDRAIRIKRAFIAADWAVRVFAPIALEACGKKEWADKLRALTKIVDKNTALEGKNAAADAAYADAAANAAAYAADAADAAAAYAADAAYAKKKVWLLAVDMLKEMIACK